MNEFGHTCGTPSASARYRYGSVPGVLVASAALFSLLGGALPVRAESLAVGAPAYGREDTGYIEEYLSDQRRVGSLAGSILGGALIAHPAGTVVGSVLGFVLGSQAMQEDDARDAAASHETAANTPLTDALALADQDSFGSRAGPGSIGHETSVAVTPIPIAPHGTISSYPVAPGAAHPVAPQSREQIMQICALGPPADPRLRAMCFYFQGR